LAAEDARAARALGGSIDIQNRMSARRRGLLKKYGAQPGDAPPIARIREMGIPLACGTDANGDQLQPLDRPALAGHGQDPGRDEAPGRQEPPRPHRALRLYNPAGLGVGGGGEERHLEDGKFPISRFLSATISISDRTVKDIESVLTGRRQGPSGRRPVLAPFAAAAAGRAGLAAVREYGEYYKRGVAEAQNLAAGDVAAGGSSPTTALGGVRLRGVLISAR